MSRSRGDGSGASPTASDVASQPGPSEPRGASFRRQVKATLARWALSRRRGGPSTRWHPHDEATHGWDGRRRFAEDYTFVAVQPRLALVTRLEWLPGREAHRIWMTVLRPGRVDALPEGQLLVRDVDRDRWRAGGLTLDCLQPLSHWSIAFVGRLGSPDAASGAPRRCSLELEFFAQADPFSPGGDDDPDLMARRLSAATWDAELLRKVRHANMRGYVQIGAMRGQLAIGDELVSVDAHAVRRHGWGVMDWGASDRAFRCFAALADRRRVFVHHARFPFVTLEGGFVQDAALEVQTLDRVELAADTPSAPAGPVPLAVRAEAGGPDNSVQIRGMALAHHDFVVDGRGRVGLSLVELDDGAGWAVWVGQERWLPRPGG